MNFFTNKIVLLLSTGAKIFLNVIAGLTRNLIKAQRDCGSGAAMMSTTYAITSPFSGRSNLFYWKDYFIRLLSDRASFAMTVLSSNKIVNLFCLLNFFLLGINLFAQESKDGELHGNIQTDVQYYQKDTIIGAPIVPEKIRMNAFANLIYTKGDISAGIRFESYLNALQGFDTRYQGSGVPFKYLNYKHEELELTAGNFYDQFGSGILLRAYEERSLGYDNAIEGFRVKYNVKDALYLKALVGKQRSFFALGDGIVRAIDAELAINNLYSTWKEAKTKISIGGSFVSKYQKDDNSTFVLPENVGAGSGRININRGKINLLSEYAYKFNDPNSANNYIYRAGQALLVQSSYSQKGLGISLGAKRIDNMNFRSDRNASSNNLMINYLPALSRQHTYNLLATLYPYATQPNGEMGIQAEVIYTFKKGTLYGGEYGTNVLINYAEVRSLDTTIVSDGNGYTSNFFAIGNRPYFKDFNIEINRKLSKTLKASITYANLLYDKEVIQGLKGKEAIYANVGILELNYKISATHAIKSELQFLYTKQDQGHWATALLEYSVSPHWFFAAMDQYNIGNPVAASRVHYPVGSFGYIKNAHRVQLVYGRQRAGIFCIGGVCRTVPASNGLTITITSSF